MVIEASALRCAVSTRAKTCLLLRCLPHEETNPKAQRAFTRVDLPGFYPAVYPRLSSFRDCLSRSSTEFNSAGTLEAHLFQGVQTVCLPGDPLGVWAKKALKIVMKRTQETKGCTGLRRSVRFRMEQGCLNFARC